MGQRWKIILIGMIILLAIFSRFAFLDLRPLHHDEGVNYFFAEKIIRNGGWAYDPLNYHGPFYFFLLAFSFLILGINEFGLRFPAALFGVLLVLSPFCYKIGKEKERYLGSLFLLLSPSVFYYSRYSIHEVSFVFFSLMSVYFFSLILERRNLNYLPEFALFLSAMLVSKETAIIMLFALFIMGLVNFKRIKAIKFKENNKIILFSIVLFVFVYTAFFTNFFSNMQGFWDSFKGFMPWADRGLHEIGHDKPFYYYFILLLKYEWPILLLALIGIFYFLRDREKREKIFALNLVLWLILIFLIYSFIPYKTPWLIINVSVPMCFVAGIGFRRLEFKRIKWALTFIGIIYLIVMSVYVNFVHPWQEDNDFAYVHTNKDILNLVGKINENYKEGDRILIVSEEYWPLPFYLHGKNVSYLDNERLYNYTDYNFFILRDKIFNEEDWRGYSYEEHELRGGVELELILRGRGLDLR